MASTLSEALTDKQRADGSPPDHVPAAALGVTPQTYNRWKHGGMVPGDDSAPAVAAYLAMPVEDVYVLLARSRVARSAPVMPPGDPPVTRAEFDTMKAEFDRMMTLLDDVLGSKSTPVPTEPDPAGQSPERSKPASRPPRGQ
jgi:hypothetical protein